MLRTYLADLDRRLARSLPFEEAKAYRAEIEGHLLAEIDSRIELGIDRASAEREAIAALGSARTLARAATRSSVAERERARSRWLLAIPVAFAFAFVVSHTCLWFLSLIGLVIVAGYARASFLVRRPARWSKRAAIIVFAILSAQFYMEGWMHQGFGGTGRFLLYEAPRAASPYWAIPWIDGLYEARFLLFMLAATTFGIDLVFGFLGHVAQVTETRRTCPYCRYEGLHE